MILKVSHLFFCFLIIPHLSYGADTLAVNQSLSGNQTLVSLDENFEMGFFKPGNSPNYYIGIWYNKARVTTETVVWVANRDTPIFDTFSSRLIIIDGNLVLLDESNTQIWSTNMSSTAALASVVLQDDGNLILRHGSNSSPPIWQSFDHPTHTLLPGMKLLYNKRTNTKHIISSWKSAENPAVGLFSLEVDHDYKQLVIMWNRSVQYWSSGSWDGQFYNFSYIDNENESYLTYYPYNSSVISRFIMDISGQLWRLAWSGSYEQWNLFWAQPRAFCDVYGGCGAFGVCNELMFPLCSCLTDFEPRSVTDWNLNSFSGGCVRKNEPNCKIKKPKFVSSYVGTRFVSALPENEVNQYDEAECRSSCLDYCLCNTYAFISNKCHHWNHESLDNISLNLISYDSNLETIYIKVFTPESPDDVKKNTKVLLVAGIVSGCLGLVFLCSIGVIFYRRMKNRGQWVLSEEDRKALDIPFFEFKAIVSATHNFSLANKLGQGGFGPVYKGTFPGEIEMAVKRLSSQSGQGLKEFKNEVLLIAKLQHRNLIRLLGYGMKNHEMILLYEYMPNKSLDRFIFDRTLSMRLDWALRFDIIMGIARGLLYLHQDSRLRIIHRDLKASNVLLDKDLNPKISDFGLAKIVKGKEGEGSLTRVVGTYGYMAPEYALNGLFSVKSDVFSFGVVVLEVISGKRNTGYYHNKEAFSLISYAWGLWKENRPLNLLDTALAESCNSIEVLRCLIVGMLCVQEDPQDRPTMTGVLAMLGMDIESLPDPKEPAFVSKKRVHSSPSYATQSEINEVILFRHLTFFILTPQRTYTARPGQYGLYRVQTNIPEKCFGFSENSPRQAVQVNTARLGLDLYFTNQFGRLTPNKAVLVSTGRLAQTAYLPFKLFFTFCDCHAYNLWESATLSICRSKSMILTISQLFFCFLIIPHLSYGADTLAVNQSLSGNQTLVSLDENFEMGFFKPGNSPNYYIGIWYKKVKTKTIAWVANRETPIFDTFSSRLIIIDGNLVLLDESNTQIWSTNMSSTAALASVVLQDDGNLILRHGSNSSPPIWQSFDHPTHTLLPGMKLLYNKRTNTKHIISSWKSAENPAVGLFSLEVDHDYKQLVIMWNRSVQYWSSGSWDGQFFSWIPEMRLGSIYNFSYIDNENESYLTYYPYNSSVISRFIMDISGQLWRLAWSGSYEQWFLVWSQPQKNYDVYGGCGAFGVCNEQMFPLCSCLTDFEPRSVTDWNLNSFSGGCVRKNEPNCKIKKPKFVSSYVKTRFVSALPENEVNQYDEAECRSSCLDYCLCNTYAFISNKCHHWNHESLDNISLNLISYDSNLETIYIKDRKALDIPFFEFKAIVSATHNFSLANKLGQGGFGPVYKVEP
ncbi:hypothetical protein R6Q57_013747 [Mikania cordata]